MPLVEAVEEEGEVNLDAIPDEVEEERKKQAKAKKNKDADKLVNKLSIICSKLCDFEAGLTAFIYFQITFVLPVCSPTGKTLRKHLFG